MEGQSLEQSLLLTSLALIFVLSAVSGLRYWCFNSLEIARDETRYAPIPRTNNQTDKNEINHSTETTINNPTEENIQNFDQNNSIYEIAKMSDAGSERLMKSVPGETSGQDRNQKDEEKYSRSFQHLSRQDSGSDASSERDPLHSLHEPPSPKLVEEPSSTAVEEDVNRNEVVDEKQILQQNSFSQMTEISNTSDSLDEEPDVYPAHPEGVYDYEGFQIMKYTTTIQVIRKMIGTDQYLVVVGPNTQLEEFRMPQAHQHFLKDFTVYQKWKSENLIVATLLSLGLVNMSHFTRMSRAQRKPPTDVEFFRIFDSKLGLVVFILRWGIFYSIVTTSNSSNLCQTTIKNFFYGLLLSLYVFHSRMNVDTAQLIQSFLLIPPDILFRQFKILNLQNFILIFQTISFPLFWNLFKSWFLPICDISFTFWACLEILRSKFCSGTYLLNITGYAFLLVFDRIIFEMFGALYLEFYVYESKVKAINTYSSTLYYTNAMHALFLVLVLLPIIYFLLLVKIIDPSLSSPSSSST
jgi:hypothetical protein